MAAVLDLYRRELDRVMALCGWDSLEAIDGSALRVAAHSSAPAIARAAE